MVNVMVRRKEVRALVDTGCSTTVVASYLVPECEGKKSKLVAVDGREIVCEGETNVELVVQEIQLGIRAIILRKLIDGIDVVLGMDAISQLGGVAVGKGGDPVTFGKVTKCRPFAVSEGELSRCAATVEEQKKERAGRAKSGLTGAVLDEEMKTESCRIDDKDFTAVFDGERWEVEWFWKGEEPVLRNRIGCYEHALKGGVRDEFEREVERWIKEGIMVPWPEEGEGGVIPLMAVIQPTKNKVRPVLDFRELNAYVKCHTGDDVISVCSETLRDWRQMKGAMTIVDLKSAYLQIHVAKKLWKYQRVRYQGQTYCLTRLGFGLNCAPRIMTKILKTVLGKRKDIETGTNSYIDDILVDETAVTAAEVVKHLAKFGLVTKTPEPLEGGAALGLKLEKDMTGELVFRRGNEIPEVGEEMSKRELFSACGRLVGHYPIVGWLRIACSYVKRRAEVVRWEDKVKQETVEMMKDIVERVHREDPVRGRWHAPKSGRGVVWCDASSLATGVVLEIDGIKVEDAAWLRKRGDFGHINVAELDAVLKGVNLAVKWGLQEVEVCTDSATVHGWMKSTLSAEKRIHMKGAAEVIVKRRLGILRELVDECGLKLCVVFVPSEKNKADSLTRVKKAWLRATQEDEETKVCCVGMPSVKELHRMHHMGVDRTLFVARRVNPGITREEVRQVVRQCEKCQAIDPAPEVHEPGKISVDNNWKRLAVDVTHYRHQLYLSMVDCGPGRVAIWRELRAENAVEIAKVLNEVFLERGPVEEVLMDNGTAFRSQVLKDVLDKWNVRRYFRAAYRPSGNGIVERHHRTIKTLAERGQIKPEEAVFWYNISPRSGLDETTVPQRAAFRYEWRHPSKVPAVRGEGTATIDIGEEVWVKPPDAKCTSQWKIGKVTDVHSANNLSVDGVPRHILDVRRLIRPSEDEESSEEQSEGGEVDCGNNQEEVREQEVLRRSQRERRPPGWMRDYEGGSDF